MPRRQDNGLNALPLDAGGGGYIGADHSLAEMNKDRWAHVTEYDGFKYYAWYEVTPDSSTSSGFATIDGGQFGTMTSEPMFEANGLPIPLAANVRYRRASYDATLGWTYVVFLGDVPESTCPLISLVFVTSSVPDAYGTLPAVLLTHAPQSLLPTSGVGVRAYDANNPSLPQVRSRVYSGVYQGTRDDGYCVYAVTCCDTPGVIPPVCSTAVTGGTIALGNGTAVVVTGGTVCVSGSTVTGGTVTTTCVTATLNVTGAVPPLTTPVTGGEILTTGATLIVTGGTVTVTSGAITAVTVAAAVISGTAPAVGAVIVGGTITWFGGTLTLTSGGAVASVTSTAVPVSGGTISGSTITATGGPLICGTPLTVCASICVECTYAPFWLTTTLADFTGGATIPPVTGGCPDCTTTPLTWTVNLTGFSGSLDGLNIGAVTIPQLSGGGCQWQYFAGNAAVRFYVNTGVQFALIIAVDNSYAQYGLASSGSDCCSPITLTESATTGAGGEYPATLTATPSCVTPPTTGCEQANVGAVPLASVGGCRWEYSANGVTVIVTYDGADWTATVSTVGGCINVYQGAGDCSLTGGVTLDLVIGSSATPLTLTLLALSSVNNCPEAPPLPTPGDIVTDCAGVPLPSTLFALIEVTSGDTCLDGVVVPILYNSDNVWPSWNNGTSGTASPCLVAGEPVNINIALRCEGTDCTGFEIYMACDGSAAVVYPQTVDGGCDDDPLNLVFTGVDLTGSTCDSVVTVTIYAS